ncbi:hypothetical protein ACFFTN_25915 [Aminobacter aganoensis]|uniref:Maltooligosyltrehalose synthase n=1 Tax=Aminobacter aganoensis TaxID=83264 RepID=A0A7X0KL62_9HYPH|nr:MULTISPECIES: hypothetical protein [Aminobacter]KQU75849.1 hypothetical protein ASC75_17670 [Aminobacter sp. DSM 101952]MBB6354704.1 maltooligosyltrehalose synthase [Aminobacter aganoensis]
MGEIVEFAANHVFVKHHGDGWIVRVLENGGRTDYRFERLSWAEKFARNERFRLRECARLL